MVRPDLVQLRLPDRGLKWAEDEHTGSKCGGVPAKSWLRRHSGRFSLFVFADGPSGSSRYWNVTIGVAKRQQLTPIRGICLVTSTAGWRTLQQWKKTPLPWLDDLDDDGSAEFIVWNSFPLREEASKAEYGVMAWIYRVDSENSLTLDWDLSRKMAKEIAKAYKSSLARSTRFSAPLRSDAADALEQFADKRCRMPSRDAR